MFEQPERQIEEILRVRFKERTGAGLKFLDQDRTPQLMDQSPGNCFASLAGNISQVRVSGAIPSFADRMIFWQIC